jgi:hypothetical protein
MNEHNVLAFKPRPKPVPAVQFVELRLVEDFSITMSLFDVAGNVVANLEYSLITKSPENFTNLLWS